MAKLLIASLKLLYRDKQTLFWAMVFPVMFAVVFGLFDFSGTPEVSITIVSDRPSVLGAQLEKALGRVESFRVSTGSSLAGETRRLKNGQADVVVGLPAETAPGSALRVLYNRSNFQENQFALGVIDRVVGQMNLRMARITSPPVSIRQEAMAGRSIDYYDFLLPGLVAMG